MAKALKIVGLVVAAVGIGLATAGFGAVAFTGAITATVSVTTIIGAGVILELGAMALAAKKGSTTASQTDRLTTTIDPRTPRKTVYGQTALANDLRYEEWHGPSQEYCDWIVCLASHKIEALDEVWINQQQAWTAAGGTTAAFHDYFGVFEIILEGSPSNAFSFATGKWNGAHRLTGCAYVRVSFRVTGVNSKATSPFSGGVPNKIVFIGRGGMMHDPRRDSTVPGGSGAMRAGDQSTWAYSSSGTDLGPNIPLMILREMLGWRITNPVTDAQKLAVGGGLPPRRIDMGSFIVAANIADEQANRSVGGTEPKFHGGACLSEGDDLHQRLDMLCAACNGRLREVNGKLALVVMHNDLAAAASDDGLTDDDVIGAFTWESDPPLDQCVNVIRGKFTDPSTASLFQMIDYPEVRLDSPDGIDRTMTLDLSVAQSGSHAQRVAKQALERRQYQRTFSAPFDIRAWKYQIGDVVPFTFSALSFDRRLFRVASQELTQDGTCVMSLMDENEAIYAWDADDTPAVTAAAPIVYDPTKSPLILAIGDAATTADWPNITDPAGTRPDDNATNSADPTSPFGTSTVGATRTALAQAQADVDAAEENIAAIQQAIADGASGDSVSANAAMLAAQAARDSALAARDAAQTAQSQAQAAYSAADGARGAAVDAKNLAASSATAANTSAAAAAGSASQASTSAGAAGTSATSASGSANTASVQASNAAGSAGAAATSASAAAASNTSAGFSASSAQQSSVSAAASAAASQAALYATFPNSLDPASRGAYTYDTPPDYVAGPSSWPTPYLATWTTSAGLINSGAGVFFKKGLPKSTHRYRARAWVFSYATNARFGFSLRGFNDELGNGYAPLSIGATAGLQTEVSPSTTGFLQIGCEFIGDQGSAFLYPFVYIASNNGQPVNGTFHLGPIDLEDITQSTAAATSAAAAASSASSAAASQSAAGSSASAAGTSEYNAFTSYQSAAAQAGLAYNQAVSAQGYAGSANSSASAAAASASGASGSANTAGTYASNAAAARDAAGNSASAASISASTAAGQASAAGASATSAQSSANSAASQAGNAQFYANSASSSSAAATSSAAAAQQSAMIAASVGSTYINSNAYFVGYAGTVTPDSWVPADYTGGAPSRVAGQNGRPYAVAFNAAANANAMMYQDANAAFGSFVIELTGRATDWQGAAVLVQFWNADFTSNLEGVLLNPATLADTSGYTSADGGSGAYTRSWSLPYKTGINGSIQRVRTYAMANWDGAGDRHAKSIQFDRVGVRAASAGDINATNALAQISSNQAAQASVNSAQASTNSSLSAQLAGSTGSGLLSTITNNASVAASQTAAVASTAAGIRSDLNGVSATVSQTAGTVATINGKTQAYLNITAQAGGNMAYVSVFANNGAGGLTSGVILGGNVYVDGSLTVAGSLHTGAAANNAFNAKWFAVNNNGYVGSGMGSGAHSFIDPDSGLRVTEYDDASPQQLASISVTLTARADVTLRFSAAQAFDGPRRWNFAARRNGNMVLGRGSNSVNATPSGETVIKSLAAGTYAFGLEWLGENEGVSVASTSFLVEANYVYGNN